MKIKFLKVISLIATLIVVCGIIAYLASFEKSPLITEIENYRESHGTGAGLDLTPVLKNHIKVNTSKEEVVSFLENMDFQVHQSWKDKDIFVAYYKPSSPLQIFNVIQYYRVTLDFSENRLKRFDAKVEIESP